MGIVQVMEGRRVFEQLSLEENLIVGGQSHSRSKEKQNMTTVLTISHSEKTAQ